MPGGAAASSTHLTSSTRALACRRVLGECSDGLESSDAAGCRVRYTPVRSHRCACRVASPVGSHRCRVPPAFVAAASAVAAAARERRCARLQASASLLSQRRLCVRGGGTRG
eukprot:3576489-Prymnesium_polylepis.1